MTLSSPTNGINGNHHNGNGSSLSAESMISDVLNQWMDFLLSYCNVEVRHAELPELLGYVIGPVTENGKCRVLIAEDAPKIDRIYLIIHVIAHITLGHLRTPFSSIIEPKTIDGISTIRLTERDAAQHNEALQLTRKIFWKYSEVDQMGELIKSFGRSLPDAQRLLYQDLKTDFSYKMLLFRQFLKAGFTRNAIRLGLKLIQETYVKHKLLRTVLGDKKFHEIQTLYFKATMTSEHPDLIHNS